MPLQLVATATLPTAAYLFRDGAVDFRLVEYALIGTLIAALLKGAFFAARGGFSMTKGVLSALAAGLVSAATPAVIVTGFHWQPTLFATFPALLLVTMWLSLKTRRSVEGTAWDIFTPARFGMTTIGLGMMLAVWMAFGGSMETSVSPSTFGYLRAVVQCMSFIIAALIAGLWDGGLAAMHATPERRKAVLSAAVWANLAVFTPCAVWSIREGMAWQATLQ